MASSSLVLQYHAITGLPPPSYLRRPFEVLPGYAFPRDAERGWMAHSDEYEEGSGLLFHHHMMAGAAAGVMEHVCMYPVDTIKTRLQAKTKQGWPKYSSVIDAAITITRQEGISRLYRGITAIAAAAIPSHAAYFATYEYAKDVLGGNEPGYHFAIHGMAGGLATMAHDMVTTPLDVVKQRLQVYGSTYGGVRDCIQTTIRKEGVRAFYASYPTTVVMNVPFMTVHFATYEGVKRYLSPEGDHGLKQELTAGGVAGALGGFVSTPLDVVKTRIQTEEHTSGVRGARSIIKELYKAEGLKAFTKGATARVVYFIPSAAITWSTYETCKRMLLNKQYDDDQDNQYQ